MEIKENDWRLLDQDRYLKSKTIKKVRFVTHDIDHDHTHCVFCWDKFSELNGDLHEGYSTLDEKYWICPTCFEDFKDMFAWIILKTDDNFSSNS